LEFEVPASLEAGDQESLDRLNSFQLGYRPTIDQWNSPMQREWSEDGLKPVTHSQTYDPGLLMQ